MKKTTLLKHTLRSGNTLELQQRRYGKVWLLNGAILCGEQMFSHHYINCLIDNGDVEGIREIAAMLDLDRTLCAGCHRPRPRTRCPDCGILVACAWCLARHRVTRLCGQMREYAEFNRQFRDAPKRMMECEALLRQQATPLLTRGLRKGRPSLHLADASTQVLQSSPSLWAVYQRAIAAGLPPEFQHHKRKSLSPTPVERVWWEIERLARAVVASSVEPLTLRTAVMKVVTADPSLRDRYAEALERVRRRKARSGRR